MSYLLEMLAKGLESGVAETLAHLLRASAAGAAGRGDAGSDDPDARRTAGVACLSAMQFDSAVEHLSAACRARPDDVAARLALAAAHDESAQPEKALSHLRIANDVAPGNPLVLFAIGYCLERLLRPDAAAEYYRDVVAAQPAFAPARQRLAAVALSAENLPEAIAQYEALRESDPTDSDVRAMLGHLYHRAARFAEAIAEFEFVIAMEPDNWALMDAEVESLLADGQPREAAERLRTLIDAQGPQADLTLRLGNVLAELGSDGEAVDHLLAAIDAAPDYLEAHIALGTHHLSMGRWADAGEAFARAAEINDRLLTCYVGLGAAQAAAGQRERAIHTFQLAGAVEPNASLLLSEAARLQLKAAAAGQFDASFPVQKAPPVAEPDLDNDHLLHVQIARHAEQVEKNPGYADLRYRYGVLLRAEGRLGEAREQFAEAVRINPAYVDAIIRLGITLQDIGQIDEAVETFQRALDLCPDYVDLHYRLALLHTDRRRFAEAVEHMEAAAEIAQGNGQIRAALALSLQNMGLMDRSAATWRSLSQLHPRATG